MTSLHTKLILSALGVAMLGTPAFAQRTDRPAAHHVRSHHATAYSGYRAPAVRSNESSSYLNDDSVKEEW
jgi:hypothetical protein